jgi:hypothetical protein
MSTIQLRVAGAGVSYLFIFLAGFWLSRSGAPYSVLTLTIHKLISLAAIILLGITAYQTNQAARLGAIELLVVVVAGLLFIGTIATGGMLSTEKTMPDIVHRLHRITLYLTVLFTAVSLYLLARR